ncbi:MAG TPA: ribonucleoside-diphosphate reductase subunit alpha, partial [Desulfobacterales bacterium]|nr:ribonucleoside-diphosphate reductase subunit alpha [Desulfobacterales bacterium]
MCVVKRDGSRKPVDIKKIRKQTEDACRGLKNVDFNELELDTKLQFRDGITTEEIQQTLIKTAVDKIDIDRPDWTFVAARLFLNDLYHKIGKLYHGKKGNPYSHTLHDCIKLGVENELIHPKLLDESKFNFEELNNYIKPERDLQFTYLGIKTLYDRYIIKDRDDRPIELPQHLFMGVAMWLASNEKDATYWAKRFYDVISKFEVMVATPTLSNARLNRHQLSSCYQGTTTDNIEDIFDSFKEMALLSKYGGGIGWDVTNIRALGSCIDNKKGASGGLIPWVKIINDIAISVDQLGTRKGAISVYLEPWHM